MLLFAFCLADVPDAPRNLHISEIKSPRNISLSWIPGNDHNSSITGGGQCRGSSKSSVNFEWG